MLETDMLPRGCPPRICSGHGRSTPRSWGSNPARSGRAACCTGARAASSRLFQSAGASPGTFTQMGWTVDDIDATVTELRSRGVVFEEVDLPGLKTVDGIADVDGNYPSKGSAERAAWFRDSEGNMLGIGQPIP